MDIFAPPQKAEFLAGISGNIPNNNGDSNTGNQTGCGSCGNVSNVSNNLGCGCNFR